MNFDKVINRKNTNSLKWDVPEGELPLWVADMDFETAPAIVEAIHKRCQCGAFGYSIIPEEWNNAYVNWWSHRYNFTMEKDSLIFCTGVVPAISSIVRKLTTPAEKVVILTPVYNIFFNSILNNGRNVTQCPLKLQDETYSINWELLEKDLSDPQTSMLIFCNPHNPVGKIWTQQELQKIGELCKKYNVIVVSDEIHCDLTTPQKKYIPFASASDTCRNISITCIAPTKTFNIAGLQTAAVYVENPLLHHKVWRGLNTDEVAEPNAFAVQAAIAAYNEGEQWLEELLIYLQESRNQVMKFLKKEIPQIKVIASEATYLLWLDCKDLCKSLNMNSLELETAFRNNAKVFISNGAIYGQAGEGFLRMNIASPKSILQEALNRIKKFLDSKT